MVRSRKLFLSSLLLLLVSCWYGPANTLHRIESAARKPNETTSAAVVYSEVTRAPRGLATFPNGGVSKRIESEWAVSVLEPVSRGVRVVFKQPVPPEVKNAFSADFVGWKDDVIYLQLSGCFGEECWGDLVNRLLYRVTESGVMEEVDLLPEAARFKGQSLAPMPGERNYLRLGHGFEEIRMTRDAGMPPEVIYTLNLETGFIESAGARRSNEGSLVMPVTDEACQAAAREFTRHLADRDYDEAYAMTSQAYRASIALARLKDDFEAIVPLDWGDADPIEVVQTMDTWPGKQDSDLLWVYLSIYGDVYSEALVAVVASEDGEPRIREVEFGRP